MEQRISLVTLGVTDVAVSRAFYERLGWEASSIGGDEVAFFQAGGMILALYNREDLAKDVGFPTGSGDPGGVALAYNAGRREDVDTVLAEARKAGARILRKAEDKSWGGYSGYFVDPDGHPWEVAWNPGFVLPGDGSVQLPA
ncbi:MAG TPA: VOC family protein [bacterium]|nr:VOC family protein [bacterium]